MGPGSDLEGLLVDRGVQVRGTDGRQHCDLAHEGTHAVRVRLHAHAAHVAAHGGHRDPELHRRLRCGIALAQDGRAPALRTE